MGNALYELQLFIAELFKYPAVSLWEIVTDSKNSVVLFILYGVVQTVNALLEVGITLFKLRFLVIRSYLSGRDIFLNALYGVELVLVSLSLGFIVYKLRVLSLKRNIIGYGRDSVSIILAGNLCVEFIVIVI